MRERRQRCPACGVSIPGDAGGCPTCGHEIGDALVVAVGDDDGAGSPAGPAALATGRRSPRGRRTALLIGAVLAVLVGVLAVVDGQADDGGDTAEGAETTTTRGRDRRTRTTRATTTTSLLRTFTPTIPLPAGVRLLGWLATGDLEVLDPAAGMVVTRGLTSRGGPYYEVVPRLDGAVVVDRNSGRSLWMANIDNPDDVVPMAGNVGEVTASDLPGRVWVMTYGSTPLAQELDLGTMQPTISFSLPTDVYLSGVVDGGVVLGSPDGLYLRRRDDDQFQRIVYGTFIASAGSLVAYRACDDHLVCGLFVHDLLAGRSMPLDATVEGWPQWAEFSPDRRWLAISAIPPNGSAPTLQVIDVDSGDARVIPVVGLVSGGMNQLAWTPDSQWLLRPEGPGIHGYHPADGSTATIDLERVYEGVAVLGQAQ